MIDVLKPCIGVASLSSPLEVGADRAPGAVKSLVQVLQRSGFQAESFGQLMAEKVECELTDFGDIDGTKNSWLHEEAKKKKILLQRV